MLIIIEGIDRTGKSSLARALARLTDGRIIHAGKPEKHPIQEYVAPLADYDPRGTETIILDRWHIGERVWPRYFDRDSSLDEPTFRWIEMFMQSRGALTVFAERDDYAAWAAELEAADEPVRTEEDIERCIGLFEDARGEMQNMDQTSYRHDWNVERQTADILTRARRAQEVSAKLHAVTSQFVGSSTPDILLVGDIAGIQARDGVITLGRPPILPFAPYLGTSGHFLMSTMCKGRRQTNWVALTNATRPSGEPEDLLNLWLEMDCPDVITLGRNADKAAENSRLPGNSRQSVHHPQYWRRFKSVLGEEGYWRLLSAAGID